MAELEMDAEMRAFANDLAESIRQANAVNMPKCIRPR